MLDSSTPISRAPGTARKLGTLYPSKPSQPYARSLTTIRLCRRARSTTFS